MRFFMRRKSSLSCSALVWSNFIPSFVQVICSSIGLYKLWVYVNVFVVLLYPKLVAPPRSLTFLLLLYGSFSAGTSCLCSYYCCLIMLAASASFPSATNWSYFSLYYFAFSVKIFFLVSFSSLCPIPNIFGSCKNLLL